MARRFGLGFLVMLLVATGALADGAPKTAAVFRPAQRDGQNSFEFLGTIPLKDWGGEK